MAAAAQPMPELTLEEYLHTAYHPDCDFVDGHLEERHMGTTKHSLLQAELVFWFRSHRDQWAIRVMSELRTQVSPSRIRLPDVTVALNDEAMREELRTTPPLIAIEILSHEDRMHRVLLRLRDFLNMGVAHIWLLDPIERVAYTYSAFGLQLIDEARLTVPHSSIYLDLPALFASLD